MTPIRPIAPAATQATARATASPGGFRLPSAADVAAPAPPGEAAPAALAGLLALQEAATPSTRDRAARRHGQALLAALAGLQRALLDSEEGPALAALGHLLAAAPPAEDPELASLLGAIALRCRIELARSEVRDPRRPAT